MFKTELYELLKLKKPYFRCYKVNNLLTKHGHSVLRLPPYHPELKPIEKIWALVKNGVASHNVTFKTDDVVQLLYDKFSSVTPEEWSSPCRLVQRIEGEFFEREGRIDEYEDGGAGRSFEIHVGSDSSSRAEESDTDSNLAGICVLPSDSE
jgi:hypothetical protein